MKGLRLPDQVIEVGYITAAGLLGLVVAGEVMQTETYERLASSGVPIVAPILRGLKSRVFQVVNP